MVRTRETHKCYAKAQTVFRKVKIPCGSVYTITVNKPKKIKTTTEHSLTTTH